MAPPKRPQQWQSFFGQDEIIEVSGITNAAWTPVDLEHNVEGAIVVNEAEEGIKVSTDGGATFVTMLRAVKTGAEFDFLDRLPIATRGLEQIHFRALVTAGPLTIKLIKRHEV